MPRILVVDDETGIRSLVKVTLAGDPRYQVDEAADGEEALKKIEANKPDLILLDIVMPKMNGIDVCRAVKANPKTRDIYVVMLSSVMEQSQRKQLEDAHPDTFFTKPFSPTALLRKLDELLAPPK